ncbi:PhoD-like phosphatase N-terminal domain-containing protein [Cryobacterium sp. TMT2-42-4]|uniref:PhoD-like phosphatase N-terminal domain-containing protein n=1 Tax=Cryobacterium sp. TMT2-42-4 TaxID=1259255 RepID=UPI001F546EA1|nr:PhoD-like phosphatase N-terminal domain-containing protein [Cryobacterium sp. TMT2-42-4]
MSPFNRRDLLRSAGVIAFAGATASAAQGRPGPAAGSAAVPDFLHGVASGDPLPDSVLLWTRVTPTPDALPGSGSASTSRSAGKWPRTPDSCGWLAAAPSPRAPPATTRSRWSRPG